MKRMRKLCSFGDERYPPREDRVVEEKRATLDVLYAKRSAQFRRLLKGRWTDTSLLEGRIL